MRPRRPDALQRRPRTAGRCEMDLPERFHRAERKVLPAAGVGGPGPIGARTVLPGNPRDLFSEPPALFRRAGADRDVPDRGTGHADDHGLAEVSTAGPSVLHLRRDLSRL